ncbi:MAG: serine/threonine-protein kinase [Thermoanaerobaculia bacterium]
MSADDGLIGATIDGFRVEALLGRGGMGEVYQAFDPRLARSVALKIVSPLLAQDREFAARFAREARSASAVSHPNIAQIYSSGEYQGRPYYVMERVAGSSLATQLDESGHIGGRRSLELLLQAAEGLRAAAEEGIVHRDIKPGNLMVDGKGRLKIVDFGLARRLAEDIRVTRTEVVVGTPTYLSPEQAQGQEVDHRSDIYSLGATFYHLLSGAPPFAADTPVGVLLQHVGGQLTPLRQRNPRVPPAVAAVIERMLEKDPARRYADYDQLIADLRLLLAGRATASEPSLENTSRLPPTPAPMVAPGSAAAHSHRLPPLGSAALGAALVLVVGIVWLARRDAGGGTGAGPSPPSGSARSAPGAAPSPPEITLQEAAAAQAGVDPQALYGMAFTAQTLANLRRLSLAIETRMAQTGELPANLEQAAREAGVPLLALRDGWGEPIQLESTEGPAGPGYRLTSAGADRTVGTADDLVLENGEIVRGDPRAGQVLPGLPPRLRPPRQGVRPPSP